MSTIQRQVRYLTAGELSRLRRHAEARPLQAGERGTVGAVRAWALLDTLLTCHLGYGQASLVVRQGKDG
jgi:hypothetical protein